MANVKSFNINGLDSSIVAAGIELTTIEGLSSTNVQDSIEEINDNIIDLNTESDKWIIGANSINGLNETDSNNNFIYRKFSITNQEPCGIFIHCSVATYDGNNFIQIFKDGTQVGEFWGFMNYQDIFITRYWLLSQTNNQDYDEVLISLRFSSNDINSIEIRSHIVAYDEIINENITSFTNSTNNSKFLEYETVKLTPNIQYPNTDSAGIINVSSQTEFDNIPTNIQTAFTSHENVTVLIKSGIYTYTNKFIDMTNWSYSGKTLNIVGEYGVKLIGAGNEYSVDSESATLGADYYSFDTTVSYYEYWGYTDGDNIIDIASSDDIMSGNIIQMTELIEIIDETNKICRAALPTELSSLTMTEEQCVDIKILVTQWYVSTIYDVTSISDGYVYFNCSDLNENSINLDYTYWKVYPRYKLLNINVGSNNLFISGGKIYILYRYKKVYESLAGTFIETNATTLDAIYVSGIEFLCSGSEHAVFNLENSPNLGYVLISNNIFTGIKPDCINCATDNVTIYKNTFTKIYSRSIYSTNKATKFNVIYNTIIDTNLRLTNYFAIYGSGTDYYIAHNTIKNFRYGGIGVGVHYTISYDNNIQGIVEYNKVYCDDEFGSNIKNNQLIDSGGIYVWTQNEQTILRYNWIYNVNGIGENRGIFCDDGTKNAIIYGNVISNISNHYTIDLRYSSSVATYVYDHNEGNLIMYNIIDGTYRFEGKTDVSTNIIGENIIIYNYSKPSRTASNLDNITEDDYYVKGEINLDYITVDYNVLDQMKKIPISNNIINKIIRKF